MKMYTGKPTLAVKFFLFTVFLIGIVLNAFIVLDAEIFNWLLFPSQGTVRTPSTEGSQGWEGVKKSILLVIPLDCKGKPCGTGTGFVVRPGYVATNAHVLKCGVKCSKFILRDYKGMNHEAELEAIASGQGAEDLAVLRMGEESLPRLALADSAEYEVGHDGEEVVTVGYPLVGIASSADKASVSGRGSISTFKSDDGMFITSGMNMNAGNSGGPVFLARTQQVLGLAVGVVRGQISSSSAPVEGIDYVIPVNRLKNFFLEKTGQSL